eukprot:CAMPEP_0170539816 /NCGR_PEP_ID=MMETSP0209-20121228/104225_1 /TAXON_ID=665100 ORGANISM="Litonotus pictus, Strain P1" /NCGR_SAMPLE_ID=MMETSP0209 /ASSEMBLY_ACC=CAM_ASM_000301 /LENGTH=254 /DNA_ID=CAMNT_0010841959 /DNA_START=776 /DNA_END=1537 /DNA_ORIENTATION=+
MDKSNNILSFLIDAPTLTKKTLRNYLKVQELFARVGGLANAFWIIIKILTYHFMKFKYYFFVYENSFAIVKEAIKEIERSESAIKKDGTSKDNNSIMPLVKKNNLETVSKYFEELKREKNIVKEGKAEMEKKEVDQSRKEEKRVEGSSSNKKLSNNYVNINQINQEGNSEALKLEVKESPKINNQEAEQKLQVKTKSIKFLELKKERKETIVGKKEYNLEPSEIKYWEFLRSTAFPCCISQEKKKKYDYEVKRI